MLGAAWFAAALALSLVLLLPRLEDWGHPMDEGAVLAYADLVREGAVPHRDFLTTVVLVAGAFLIWRERSPAVAGRVLVGIALFVACLVP